MGEHIPELSDDKSHEKGCVSKHQPGFRQGDPCSYRANGYSHMSSAHVAMYHIDFTVPANGARLPQIFQEHKIGHEKTAASLRTPDNPKEKRDAWWFTRAENYKTAYLPFNHNYHHILPATALHELPVPELKLLQEAGYNLNGKENMIILPCSTPYAVAMELPDHPYGHPVYNKATKQIVNDLKGNAQEAQKTHKVTPENVSAYKTKLLNWQARQFEEIKKYGKSIAAMDQDRIQKNLINRCPVAPANNE